MTIIMRMMEAVAITMDITPLKTMIAARIMFMTNIVATAVSNFSPARSTSRNSTPTGNYSRQASR